MQNYRFTLVYINDNNVNNVNNITEAIILCSFENVIRIVMSDLEKFCNKYFWWMPFSNRIGCALYN